MLKSYINIYKVPIFLLLVMKHIFIFFTKPSVKTQSLLRKKRKEKLNQVDELSFMNLPRGGNGAMIGSIRSHTHAHMHTSKRRNVYLQQCEKCCREERPLAVLRLAGVTASVSHGGSHSDSRPVRGRLLSGLLPEL